MSDQDTPEKDGPREPVMEEEGSNDGGSAEPGTEGTEETSQTRPEQRARPIGRGVYFLLILALAFAFFAASASGFLWWQYRQFYVALDQADSESAGSIQDIRASLRSLTDRVETLQASDALMLDATTELDRRLEELPGRFRALENRVNAVQGVSGDARQRWLRAEAEYYLTVANTELTLGGDWGNAITALELGDSKLRELGNPAFGEVRQRISEELQALRSARLPDVEGLSYSLGRLADRVEELPMGAVAPGSFVTEPDVLEDAEPGLSRVWLSLKQAVSGMISVERSDAPSSRALTSEEQLLVRRQLALELEIARLGLLRNQTEVFQVSLGSAGALLTRHFDGSNASVESAISLLQEMIRLDIDPSRPDISGSLNLLRGLPDREG